MLSMILKSKYTWVIGILISVVTYYQLSLWDKNFKIQELLNTNTRIELNLMQSKKNYDVCSEVNKENNHNINKMQENLDTLNSLNSQEVQGKLDEISILKQILIEDNTNINYANEIFYNGIVKIRKEPSNEDTTYTIINNIGN